MKSLTYILLLIFSVFLLSLSSCAVGDLSYGNHNNYGKFYSSSGSFMIDHTNTIRRDEPNIIYVSDDRISIYYDNPGFNVLVHVYPIVRNRSVYKFRMHCCNDVFTLNTATMQFYISKVNEKGAIGDPYRIFFNLKEIKK